MKLKTLLTTIVLGLSVSTASYANDINLSWSMRALQGQALTQTIKQAKLKKYSKPKLQIKQLLKKQSTKVNKNEAKGS